MLHPAGVTLPFDRQSDAEIIIPEVRSAICRGTYSAGTIRLLRDAVRPGDRVLVIGAGLGVVSTLVAQTPGVERVIAVEADTSLHPYLERVHALNDVPWVETVNAVLGDGAKRRVPFFVRRDIRESSLLPSDDLRQQVMMVPVMDLNVILTEEQITLVICDLPATSMQLLGQAQLGSVERIIVPRGGELSQIRNANEISSGLAGQGFAAEERGTAALFERKDASVRSIRSGRVKSVRWTLDRDLSDFGAMPSQFNSFGDSEIA
jgi:FkbM family methyltransferase